MTHKKCSGTLLITGGAGFIGSHLAQELVKTGYNVRVLDNFSARVHGALHGVPRVFGSNVEVVQGDVRSADDAQKALAGVDVVYHLAASHSAGQSMHEIAACAESNIVGTANLLEQMTKRRDENTVQRFIIASSMSIYGEGQYLSVNGEVLRDVRRNTDRLVLDDWDPVDQNGHALKPIPTQEEKCADMQSVYALCKYTQERMSLLIGKNHGIPTVALRLFNVYGRGQSPLNPYTGVMASFGSRILEDAPPVVFEDGRQQRDFVHVSDVARACRLAMDCDAANGHVINIGGGEQTTVADIAFKMAKVFRKPHIRPEITRKYREGDIRHSFADIGLAKKLLGYVPRVTVDEGIEDYCDWLRSQNIVRVERTNELALAEFAV